MYLIGLTGGIASGKSVVAQRLASHGAVVVDADVLARQVVEPGTPGLAAIAETFGPTVIAPDGTLDRAALGAIVFRDAEARAALNEITHPAIVTLGNELFEAAEARDPHAVGVYDVPLLAETWDRHPRSYDLVVVVEASADTRIRRLVDLRGMTPEEAAQRVAAQATDSQRRAIADVVIDSDGTLDETLRQIDEVWAAASASAQSKHPA